MSLMPKALVERFCLIGRVRNAAKIFANLDFLDGKRHADDPSTKLGLGIDKPYL